MLIRRFASSARFAAGSSWCARLLIAGVLVCGLALAERAHAQARADETLVHDPGVGFFVDDWPGINHYWGGTVKLTVGAVFVGNGKPLSRVGIYFTNDGTGGPNTAAITQWNWRVLFYETLADFQNNPGNPQVNILLNGNGNPAPTNPDWQEVLFQMDVNGDLYDVRYAEVDLNELDVEIATTLGQYQVATLIMQGTNSVGKMFIPIISSSTAGELNWWQLNNDGVFPINNWTAPHEHGATLITTKQVDTEPPCEPTADLNCDGVVNVSDLLILLGAWGACTEPDACPADLNDDGVVNVSDLLVLLANWG